MTQLATRTTWTAPAPVRAGQPNDRDAGRVTLTDRNDGCISVDLLGGLRVRAGETIMGPRELGGAKPRRVLLGGAMTTLTKDDTTLRVLVVDDHSTFAELLTGAIDRERDLVSVGHATTGADAVAKFAELRPDVVLMDVQLPDISGFAATAQILAMNPNARVIMLTAQVTADAVANAAASGVCGFLAKDGHFADLLSTLRTAKRGSLAVDPGLVTRLIDQPRTARRALARPLSQREISVLVRMADGRDVTAIAHELRISSHTCRGHVKSVLSKLGAHSQLEAVTTAVRIGLIQIKDEHANAVGF